MNKKVLVFGATGKTGVQVCNQLSEQHLPFSVFVRNQSAEKLSYPKEQIEIGDVTVFEDVKKALSSPSYTDIVISLGSKTLRGDTVRSAGTAFILKALKEADLHPTIHVISACGVGNSWEQLKWSSKLMSNLLLKSVMKDHGLQEKLVEDSQLKFHILRPVGLKDGEAKGAVHVQAEGYLPSSAILRSDLAKYLVESLIENKEGYSSLCEKK